MRYFCICGKSSTQHEPTLANFPNRRQPAVLGRLPHKAFSLSVSDSAREKIFPIRKEKMALWGIAYTQGGGDDSFAAAREGRGLGGRNSRAALAVFAGV